MGTSMPKLSDPANVQAPASKARPRFTFTVPESARLSQDDPTTVTLVPITLGEEQMAAKAATAGGSPLGYELAKLSLAAVDGRVIDWAGGARDAFFDKVSPAVRQLVLSAWAKVNTPAAEAEKDFLASMVTEL